MVLGSSGVQAASASTARNVVSTSSTTNGKLDASQMYILLLGPPGSGKTTFARMIKANARQEISLLNDRDTLLEMSGDPKYSEILFQTGKNSFSVLNNSVYDIALNELGRKIKTEYSARHFLCVEFSRNNYLSAVRILSDYINISGMRLLYMCCNISMCVARNEERSSQIGGYSVPEDEMLSYFAQDDHARLNEFFPHLLHCIANKSSLEALQRKAKKICNQLGI